MFSFIKRHQYALGLFFAVTLSLLPLLLLVQYMPCKDDAEGYLGLLEAIRKSILEYHEFPFWNPWGHGGVPLFADNNAPVFALEFPCILLFGVFYGIRISFLLYNLLCAYSAYLFLGDYTESRLGRFYGACIYSLMGGFSLHNINGHEVFMGFCYLPLLLWLVRRLADKKWCYSAAAGVVTGLLINHEIHYPSLFSITVACVFALVPLIRHWREPHFWRNVALGATATLAIGGYRLVLTSAYLKDYPREMSQRMTVPVTNFIRALVVPFPLPRNPCALSMEMPGATVDKPFGWEWHELGCYIGLIVIFFAIYSLMHRIRWYHWAVLLTAILTIDCSCPLLPGYWLREIPAFKSCFVMTRWRFVMVLFIAICAANGATLALTDKLLSRRKILCLMCISCLALMVNQCWTYIFAIPPTTEEQLMAPPENQPVSPGKEFRTMSFEPFKSYYCVKNNICNRASLVPVQAYYHEAKFVTYTCTDGKYQGELYGPGIRLLKQTPNRYIFSAEGPARVTVNANPSNYWRISGKRLFPGYRTFEDEKAFVFDVPQAGTYMLYAVPPVHEKGLRVTVAGAALFALILLGNRILSRRKSVLPEHQTS